MRRLELDFQHTPDRPSRAAGWLLLVTGIALLAEMGVSYDKLQNEQEAMNKEIRASRLRLDLSGKAPVSRQFMEKDFDEARQIMKRLAVPWESLFTGLESVNSTNVAITSIEPDMQTGLVRIDGEAKDFAAALTLVSQLRTTKYFSEVFLSRHEIKRDDPLHPIGFSLSVRWMRPL